MPVIIRTTPALTVRTTNNRRYDTKRAAAFMAKFKGQFHGFRGGPRQYRHYIIEAIGKVGA